MVEVRERVEEIVVPVYVEAAAAGAARSRSLFASAVRRATARLRRAGRVARRRAQQATEDTAPRPGRPPAGEAAEALLELADRRHAAEARSRSPLDADPFEHPDAQRRFRVVTTSRSWRARWTTRGRSGPSSSTRPSAKPVERDYSGPARVSGSAGTGKTIVALHRAVHLARANPDARVLLTTFSEPLANALRTKLRRLIDSEPRLGERIDVHALDAIARRLYELTVGPAELASHETSSATCWREASQCSRRAALQPPLPADRVGRGRRRLAAGELGSVPRRRAARPQDAPAGERSAQLLWAIFERVRGRAGRARTGHLGRPVQPAGGTAVRAARQPPFDFVVVDEAQDLERRAASLPRRARRRPPERALLRRRPRPADLPAAVLLEGARRGHPRPLPHAAGQLPHLAPDPQRRPTACSGPR